MRDRSNPDAIRKLEVENMEREAVKEKLSSAMFVRWSPRGRVVNLRDHMKDFLLKIQSETDFAFLIKTYGVVKLGPCLGMEKHRNQ